MERAAAERPRTLFISLPVALSRGMPVDLVRCTIYLAIVNRANGIYLYMTDYNDSDGEQIPMMRGIVLELRRLMPVLLAPPTPQTITVSPVDSGIEFLEREVDGTRYLIAVNPTREEKTVDFESPIFSPDRPVAVRFELPRKIPAFDHAFRDSFAPCSVHIYEIR